MSERVNSALAAIELLDMELSEGSISPDNYRARLARLLDSLTEAERNAVDERLAASDVEPQEHLKRFGLGAASADNTISVPVKIIESPKPNDTIPFPFKVVRKPKGRKS
jgi:hypothetical protein